MKYASKQELLSAIRGEHDRLMALVGELDAAELVQGGVWGDGWSVKDLLAHLGAWHRLFLRWYEEGAAGRTPAMPAPGFKWNETPRLNRSLWQRHERARWSEVLTFFEETYAEVLELVESLDEGELLEPGRFPWTGKHPLTTYLGPNTASHYRFAIKVLKRRNRSARG